MKEGHTSIFTDTFRSASNLKKSKVMKSLGQNNDIKEISVVVRDKLSLESPEVSTF